MQQRVHPHHIRRGSMGHPSLRPHTVGIPPRRRFRDSGGWLRALVVLIVTFFVVWLAGSAIMNEIDGGKGGGDPWFNVPPFKTPDYKIPPPPSWIGDSLPPRQLPTRRGYGDGWRECRPGPGGGWDCGGPGQRGRR